jgi:hypothetical protein
VKANLIFMSKNLNCSDHCATSRKILGSRPEEVNEYFPIYLILSAALDTAVHSDSNRYEYKKQKNNVSGQQSAAGV